MLKWLTEKESGVYLRGMEQKLKDLPDHKRLSFIKKHEGSILKAMQDSPSVAGTPSGIKGEATPEAKYLI